MTSFRDGVMKIVPPWLLGPNGQRVLYSLTLPLDVAAEWLFQGIKARFPLSQTPGAEGPLARDRGIVKGFEETSAGFAQRLTRWLDDWASGGSAAALMRQVQAYMTPHAVPMRVVDNSGNWYSLDATGALSYVRSANWNWDNQTTRWDRFWLIIYPPADLWTEGPSWNTSGLWGGTWGGGVASWGSTANAKQIDTIRRIVSAWKPEHSVCINIILAFDPTSFDPSSPAGPPMPDGQWGSWGKIVGGVRVPSRLSTARYCDGV